MDRCNDNAFTRSRGYYTACEVQMSKGTNRCQCRKAGLLCTDLCSCSDDDDECENHQGECDDDDSNIEDEEDDDVLN